MSLTLAKMHCVGISRWSLVAVDQRVRGGRQVTSRALPTTTTRSAPWPVTVAGPSPVGPGHATLLIKRDTMATSPTVTRCIAFTCLDPDDDWQALGRLSATLSWHQHDPLMISLVLPAINNSRWVMARELLLDGLVCQYPGGIGDGCCYWVPWDDNNVVLELQLPHDDYITLRARRSALASFLAATVYHEFSDPFALAPWHQFERSSGRSNDGE